MSNFFSFLKGATVEEVKDAKGSGPRKQRNPDPLQLAIRVWKDGSVHPSQALADKFNLEYPTVSYIDVDVPAKKEGEQPSKKKQLVYPKEVGNGFDVIDSRFWGSYKAMSHMLFIAAVPKDAGKVDLFGTATYDQATGKPNASVMDQGAATFGQNVLLPAIKELYGIELTDEKPFVDMVVTDALEGVNICEAFSKPITFVPKRVTRGDDKGKADYQRRENLTIYGFVPHELLTSTLTVSDPGAVIEDGPDDSAAAAKALNKAVSKHKDAVVMN